MPIENCGIMVGIVNFAYNQSASKRTVIQSCLLPENFAPLLHFGCDLIREVLEMHFKVNCLWQNLLCSFALMHNLFISGFDEHTT